MVKPIRRQRALCAPVADAEPAGGTGPVHAPPVRGLLNDDAIRKLRDLDPTGEGQLLSRVCGAFETSLNRLLPQLVKARDSGDAPSVRLVAHTLKSSSATVGAQALTHLCIDVEVLAREHRLAEASEGISSMLLEAQAVRQALHDLCGEPPEAAAAP